MTVLPQEPASRKTARLSQHHVSELDGIRGVAILLVLLFHFGLVSPPSQPVVAQALGLGWCGVDLFFVLSGFLITGILVDSKGSQSYFLVFYARRVLRIFPLYYAIL